MAVESLRNFISNHVDKDNDVSKFVKNVSVMEEDSDETIEEFYDESDIDNEKFVTEVLLPSILCGKTMELPKRNTFTYLSGAGADVKYECFDSGELTLSVTGGWEYRPFLVTNCVDMTNPELKYYFRMENWFGEDHIICSVELMPVTV